jgi:mono/diheme cytochrome c family protein
MKNSNRNLAAAVIFLCYEVTTGIPRLDARAAVDGKNVFEKNCSVCHSVTPPPKSAPPILPISARYHQRFSSRYEGIRQMAAFIKAPSKEKVLADEQAITRFGLMPPIPLSREELNAVAAWVWDQPANGSWGKGGSGSGDCYKR